MHSDNDFAASSLLSGKRIIGLLGVIGILLILTCVGQLFEQVDADEYVIFQDLTSGSSGQIEDALHVVDTPSNFAWQGFRKVTHYKKQLQFSFSAAANQGSARDESIQTRFNDAGHARISGVTNVQMPTDNAQRILMHTRFGTQDAVMQQLVRPAIERAVFFSGPLMSSKEAFSTGTNRLFSYIEDQSQNGVYKRWTQEKKVQDVTGAEKTITVENIIEDKDSPNGMARQETSPLTQYGVRLSNMSISSVIPDDKVKEQIAKQQEIEMGIQTSIANAKMAAQTAETERKNGEANAAKAEWEAKTVKAKAVVDAQRVKEVAETEAAKEKAVAEMGAQQRLNVAQLDAQAMAEYKKGQVLKGDADAYYKEKVMAADGALAQKLEAYVTVNKVYADAIKSYQGQWVPLYMAGGAGEGENGAISLMNILSAKAAKDLTLDLSTAVHKK